MEMVISAERPFMFFMGGTGRSPSAWPQSSQRVTVVACLARRAHGAWGTRDARNALLAHRPSRAHLAIAWRTLGTLRQEGVREGGSGNPSAEKYQSLGK